MPKITVHEGASYPPGHESTEPRVGQELPDARPAEAPHIDHADDAQVKGGDSVSITDSETAAGQPDDDAIVETAPFEPERHTVGEVNGRLSDLEQRAASDDRAAGEFERILSAERAGRKRAGILSVWEAK